jgi:hypothetical protein
LGDRADRLAGRTAVSDSLLQQREVKGELVDLGSGEGVCLYVDPLDPAVGDRVRGGGADAQVLVSDPAVGDLVGADRVVGEIVVGDLAVDDVRRADLVLAGEGSVDGVGAAAHREAEQRDVADDVRADVRPDAAADSDVFLGGIHAALPSPYGRASGKGLKSR